MKNFKVKKIVLGLFILSAFFPILARSTEKSNKILEQQFRLENSSSFLVSQNEDRSAQYYLERANNYALQGKW